MLFLFESVFATIFALSLSLKRIGLRFFALNIASSSTNGVATSSGSIQHTIYLFIFLPLFFLPFGCFVFVSMVLLYTRKTDLSILFLKKYCTNNWTVFCAVCTYTVDSRRMNKNPVDFLTGFLFFRLSL